MKKKYAWIWIVAGVTVIALAIRVALYFFADGWDQFGWREGYLPMMGGWMMPFGMLGMGAFWVFIAIVIIRSFKDRHGCVREQADARLKARLANGDITIEEYETLRKKIKEED